MALLWSNTIYFIQAKTRTIGLRTLGLVLWWGTVWSAVQRVVVAALSHVIEWEMMINDDTNHGVFFLSVAKRYVLRGHEWHTSFQRRLPTHTHIDCNILFTLCDYVHWRQQRVVKRMTQLLFNRKRFTILWFFEGVKPNIYSGLILKCRICSRFCSVVTSCVSLSLSALCRRYAIIIIIIINVRFKVHKVHKECISYHHYASYICIEHRK